MAFKRNNNVIDSPGNNFVTWNSLSGRNKNSSSPFLQPTFSEGNTKVTAHASEVTHAIGSIASSGKHYAEFIISGSSPITAVGVISSEWDKSNLQSYIHNFGGACYTTDGNLNSNGGMSDSTPETITTSFRVGIEVDFTANEVVFFRVDSDGTKTQQGSTITTDIDFKNSGTFAATLHNSSEYIEAYFNENEWWGTPNDGYVSLCSANLPSFDENPQEHFKVVTYKGDSSGQTISVGMKPDLVWLKRTSNASSHILCDTVRGAKKILHSDLAKEENHDPGYPNQLSSFHESDGFTFDGSDTWSNTDGQDYVAWCWKAGGAGGKYNIDGVPYTDFANTGLTAGDIEPIGMSVNTKAGFSIVKYQGGSDVNTIPHGLNSAPEMIIIKNLENANGWVVGSSYLSSWAKGLGLDIPNDEFDATSSFNSIAPDDNIFTLGNSSGANNSSYNYIAYCWHSVPGYSAFGSYTGNGSADGPFVYTGFKPAWLMVKDVDAGNSWAIIDSTRNPYNPLDQWLMANSAGGTYTYSTGDFTSSGFKLRNSGGGTNTSGRYIYMAFAEHSM